MAEPAADEEPAVTTEAAAAAQLSAEEALTTQLASPPALSTEATAMSSCPSVAERQLLLEEAKEAAEDFASCVSELELEKGKQEEIRKQRESNDRVQRPQVISSGR